MADEQERSSKRQKVEHDSDSDIELTIGESKVGMKISSDTGSGAENSTTSAASKNAESVARNGTPIPNPMSKNQQKKLRRQQKWEAQKEERRAKRKEVRHKKQDRRRELKATLGKDAVPPTNAEIARRMAAQSKLVPVTLLIDCDFNDLMLDNELKSLASQITRIYSDNKVAPYRCHLAVSSFGGKLKDRFENVLQNQYKAWTTMTFSPDDFVQVSKEADERMRNSEGGEVLGSLLKNFGDKVLNGTDEIDHQEEKSIIQQENEEAPQPSVPESKIVANPDASASTEMNNTPNNPKSQPEDTVIYLSSESDNTITELKPNHTYIIGGLVDHNRHKGICYRRALDRKIQTARLPIGDYLDMASRKVLATNHVAEIMMKWLECGDWGEAFLKVIPKRKGGQLKRLDDGDGGDGEVAEDDDLGDAEDTEGGLTRSMEGELVDAAIADSTAPVDAK